MRHTTHNHSAAIRLCIRTAMCDLCVVHLSFETPQSQKLVTKRSSKIVCAQHAAGLRSGSCAVLVRAPPARPVGM